MSFVNTCWIMTLIIGYIIMFIILLLGVGGLVCGLYMDWN